MKRKPLILLLLLIAWLVLEPSQVYAASETEETLTVVVSAELGNTALQGMEFNLYKVGTLEPDGTVNWTDSDKNRPKLESSSSAQEWMGAANLIADELGGEKPMLNGTTGADGRLSLSISGDDAQSALYLLIGQPYPSGNTVYTASPALFSGRTAEEGMVKICVKLEEQTRPGNPSVPPDELLPQTGTVVWPYYCAAALGLMCIGFALGSGRKASRIFALPAFLLFLVAIGAASYFRYREEQAEKTMEKNLSVVTGYIDRSIGRGKEEETEKEMENESAEAAETPYESEAEPSTEIIPVIDGYIGTIEVPALGILLPVTEGWDYEKLEQGACCYYGGPDDPTMVIAGHSYRHFFRPLRQAQEGQQVIFTDMQGNQTTYVIAKVEILGPDEVERMVSSEYVLTLFTCTSGCEARCAVRCVYPNDEV